MITIVENNEPLVDIKKYCPGIIIRMDEERLKKERTLYLRKSVADKLNEAKKYLPNSMTFIIGEAWRPREYQKNIYDGFIRRFTKKYPDWPKEKIIKEADKYAAPYTGKKISGHMTGAALDIRLYSNGKKVPMKSFRLSYQENSKSIQPKLPKYIKRNRKILFNALEKAELSNYPNEYWHWSYGDIWWAKRNKKKTAIYGPIYKIGKA